MGKQALLQKKERIANIYMTTISILGFIALLINIAYFEIQAYFIIFSLLVLFLAITEYYPFPVMRGNTTLNFPIIFTIDLVYGLPVMVTVYALVVFIVNIIHNRPFRVVCFNPAQLILSYLAAKGITMLFFTYGWWGTPISESATIIEIVLITTLFYVINNAIVDIVLVIRPQPYTFAHWRQKTCVEAISFLFSLIYVFLLSVLAGQNRGIIDGFSFFFFFSPLIGLALLGASNTRLRKEKNRLKTLFSITKQLNKRLPSKEWMESLHTRIEELLGVEATMLWTKEEEEWKLVLLEGRIEEKVNIEQPSFPFEHIKKATIFPDTRKEASPAAAFFDPGLRASVCVPLAIEKEVVGMLVVGRSRSHSFHEEEMQIIKALANQLAVVVKTRLLISEQEKRVVLEERNRIAREIHDGIAQTLAGGIMKLETIKRKGQVDEERSLPIIEDSLEKLRHSLKEVREVIYALRPYPTEYVSLGEAMRKRISMLNEEHGLSISFEVRGLPVILDNEVEKVMFDTLQESLQNTIKHAKATRIEVQLSYQTKHVLLKVKDNGQGFSLPEAIMKARNGSHFGIISMNEEAMRIGASLQIESEHGEGTVIMLQVSKC